MSRALQALTAAALIASALLAAGCGAGADRAQRMTLAALAVRGSGPGTAPSSPAAKHCGVLTASLHPSGHAPTPGSMPPGTYMARIQHRGFLIAGVDQNTLLFSYFNPIDGRLEGFEIDMLRDLAGAIFGDPNKIQFKAITTAERVHAVQDGSVDVVADAMTITCQRRQQVDFSTVYFDAGQRVLVPSDSRVSNIRGLAHRRVCTTAGSTSIENLARVAPRVIRYAVPQRTDCLVELQEGRVDAVSTDDAILLGFKAQDPYTKIVGPRFSSEPYGMAISKAHPDFVRFVNGVLATMRTNGTWKTIYSRWLGKFGPVPAPPQAQYGG